MSKADIRRIHSIDGNKKGAPQANLEGLKRELTEEQKLKARVHQLMTENFQLKNQITQLQAQVHSFRLNSQGALLEKELREALGIPLDAKGRFNEKFEFVPEPSKGPQ